MYNIQTKKRKFFNLGSPIHKIQRVDQQLSHEQSILESLLSVNHLKDRILHYACDSYKAYQTLEKVNKKTQSLTSEDYVDTVKICVETESIYEKRQSGSFIHKYRNVKLTFDDSDHTMDFLEKQSSNITRLKIVYRGISPLTVKFTDKKWPQLLSLSLEGEWHNIFLLNLPDTVCHLVMIKEVHFDEMKESYKPIICLPPKLKTFKVCTIEPSKISNYPESLEQMTILSGCKESFPDKVCFKKMLRLRLGYYWNSPILQNQFHQLTHLYLNGRFDQSVDNLPPQLTHLYLDGRFNQSVDKLPPNLTYLSFVGHFNQPVNHLPPKLTHLYLSGRFDQPIDQLPPKLTHLSLSDHFDQSIDNLPTTLEHLSITGNFRGSIDFLPSSLTHLTLICKMESDIQKLPDLKFLSIDTEIQRINFPPTLETLVTCNTLYENNFSLMKVSNCLKYLQINIRGPPPVIYIPTGVIHFQFPGLYYNAQTIIYLSDTVKTIHKLVNSGEEELCYKFYPEDWNSRASYTLEKMDMVDRFMDPEQDFL